MKHLILLCLVCVCVNGIRISHKLKDHSTITTSGAGGYVISLSDSKNNCQSKFFTTAVSPSCCASQRIPIPQMDAVCKYNYDQTALAYQMDINNPKSWSCKKQNTISNRHPIDISGYCQSKGYATAVIPKATPTSPQPNVFSWSCSGNKPNYALIAQELLDQVCQSQAPNKNSFMVARYSNYQDPKSIYCVVNYVSTGVMDITSITNYCKSSSMIPPCSGGTTQATLQLGKWYCEGQPSVDFTAICKSKGMTYDPSQSFGGTYKCK